MTTAATECRHHSGATVTYTGEACPLCALLWEQQAQRPGHDAKRPSAEPSLRQHFEHYATSALAMLWLGLAVSDVLRLGGAVQIGPVELFATPAGASAKQKFEQAISLLHGALREPSGLILPVPTL